MTTPTNPGSGYVLDWENPADRVFPTLAAPNGWQSDYTSSAVLNRIGSQVAIHQRRLFRLPAGLQSLVLTVARSQQLHSLQRFLELQFPWFPRPRSGSFCVRFELRKPDGPPPPGGSKRAELEAAGHEPLEAERWYGFSVYLRGWDYDDSSHTRDIIAQWHHSDPNNSPPLSVGTVFKDGVSQWEIVQHHDEVLIDATGKKSFTASVEKSRVVAGRCGPGWTDFVVHAVWSPTARPEARVEVWRNGSQVAGLIADGQQSTYGHDSAGTPIDPSKGNYMKFGIYKWPWMTEGGNDDKRIALFDELRVTDGSGSYADVEPRPRPLRVTRSRRPRP